jgi:hypothetical protein
MNTRLEDHVCYDCLFLPQGRDADTALSSIVPMRLLAIYLLHQSETAPLSTSQLIREALGSQSPTETRQDWILSRFTDEGLLLKQKDCSWQALSVDWQLRQEIESKYIQPLASIEKFYEAGTSRPDSESRQEIIERALDAYAGGRDYKKLEGGFKVVCIDSFGEPVTRWGYHSKQDGSARKRKMPPTGSEMSATRQPPRRRKISISRFLISIDRSPSPASGGGSDFDEQMVTSTDFSETA